MHDGEELPYVVRAMHRAVAKHLLARREADAAIFHRSGVSAARRVHRQGPRLDFGGQREHRVVPVGGRVGRQGSCSLSARAISRPLFVNRRSGLESGLCFFLCGVGLILCAPNAVYLFPALVPRGVNARPETTPYDVEFLFFFHGLHAFRHFDAEQPHAQADHFGDIF